MKPFYVLYRSSKQEDKYMVVNIVYRNDNLFLFLLIDST